MKEIIEVVAGIIWDRDDAERKILVCKRPIGKARGGLWEFAGGKLEEGETCQAALVRECREELGITVAPGRLYMELEHEYQDLTVHLSVFEACIIEGDPTLLEHDELRWITPLEFSELPFCPADESILQKLLYEYAMERIPCGMWRHFKGNTYEVLGIAKHSETLEPMVMYRALYGDELLWTRPAAMWLETVERDGKCFPRFTYMGDRI